MTVADVHVRTSVPGGFKSLCVQTFPAKGSGIISTKPRSLYAGFRAFCSQFAAGDTMPLAWPYQLIDFGRQQLRER